MTARPPSEALGLPEIDQLRYAGLVSDQTYLAAARLARDQDYWSRWAARALLALGLSQLLAGVIFFFAYNWSALGDLQKFGLIEGAIALAVVGAFFCKEASSPRKALLVAASMLVGVLLAVVGQVYQTGADVYELFLAWAVLILPWTIASRSAALWFVWLATVELAATLFSDQVLVTIGVLSVGKTSTIAGLIACLALAMREVALRLGCDWLSSRWTRYLPIAVGLVTLFGPAAAFALDYYESESDLSSAVVFVLALAGLFFVYRRILVDYPTLVAGIGFADLFFIVIGVRVIDDTIGFNFFDSGEFFAATGMMILWAGFGTGMAAVLMRRLRPTGSGAPA
jgi:uncharacterized membrane protein